MNMDIGAMFGVFLCAVLLWMSSEGYSEIERDELNVTITFIENAKAKGADIYNWNKVVIHYCDGASFQADAEVFHSNGTDLHRRGRRIFTSVMEEFLEREGMKNATNAILAGSSAGGLATILNCDFFQSYFDKIGRLKCISDAGFFIYGKDLPGAADHREVSRASIVKFHDLARMLPKSCTSRRNAGLCLFSDYVAGDVKTPLFILNSNFDSNQITYNLDPYPVDNQGWSNCTNNIQSCTQGQLRVIKDFGTAFLNALEGLHESESRGYFIDSCYTHDFALKNEKWQGTPKLQNKRIAEAIGDWSFDGSPVKLIAEKNDYPLLNCNAAEDDQHIKKEFLGLPLLFLLFLVFY
ncbi:hypothetical protein C2S51_021536 [Perilla frutescens var. frutescens]|nr:hypothetical protein C2S51_021536 [Perilla frutescens var. frutescens]